MRHTKQPKRVVEFIAGGSLVLAVSVLALARVLVFQDPIPQRPSTSLWTLFFADRTTLGFVRFAAIVVAAYLIASIGALAVSGRWIRGFRSGGFEVDDVRIGEEFVRELEAKLLIAERERDDALALASEMSRG